MERTLRTCRLMTWLPLMSSISVAAKRQRRLPNSQIFKPTNMFWMSGQALAVQRDISPLLVAARLPALISLLNIAMLLITWQKKLALQIGSDTNKRTRSNFLLKMNHSTSHGLSIFQ